MKAAQDYPFAKMSRLISKINIFIHNQDLVYTFHITEADTTQDPL